MPRVLVLLDSGECPEYLYRCMPGWLCRLGNLYILGSLAYCSLNFHPSCLRVRLDRCCMWNAATVDMSWILLMPVLDSRVISSCFADIGGCFDVSFDTLSFSTCYFYGSCVRLFYYDLFILGMSTVFVSKLFTFFYLMEIISLKKIKN